MDLSDIRVIAHRGNSARFPENTMAAFRSAVEVGAHMVELDVQVSSDGELVVIHDYELERTFGVSGRVASLSGAELRRIGLPALEEVLALPIAVNVEIKAAAAVPGVVELARDRDDIVVSSFDLDALDRVLALNPRQTVAYLSHEEDWTAVLARAAEAGAYALNPPRKALTPSLVERAHDAGLRVMSYTINAPAEAQRVFGWGVDAIFTDDPEAILAIL